MNVVMIVQARMGSSRLPGKVLMSCGGKPMLAHQIDRLRQVKLANRLVIATSNLPQDDPVEDFCRGYGVEFFRGDRDDVLSRFVHAARVLNADVIVRLTGDCPLIDPSVVDMGISTYLDLCAPRTYVTNVLERSYPRGMDVEVFSRELLEEAHQRAATAYAREHVTPYMFNGDETSIDRVNFSLSKNLSAYRFTLDYEKDREQISKIIEIGLGDYRLETLISATANMGLSYRDNAESPYCGQPSAQDSVWGGHEDNVFRRLGLGSAQFGMHYGKFNRDGVPSVEAIQKILRVASRIGVSSIDTAHLYGDSEAMLGLCKEYLPYFKITTKTPRFSDEGITHDDVVGMREAFFNSLALLKVNRVNGLLVHHAPNLLAAGGDRLYEELLLLKEQGRVENIGVSAYEGDMAEEINRKFPMDFVQIPINVLDRRLVDSGALRRLSAAGVRIHARSAFLQGLLLADPDKLSAHFEAAKPVVKRFQRAAAEAGLTPAHAALHYLLDMPEIDRIFVGVESVHQFNEIFKNFPQESGMNFEDFRVNSASILNPVLWGN